MDGMPPTVYKTAATRVARNRGSASSSFKIYVDNFPLRVSNSSLKQLLSDYGEVVEAKVFYHRGREAWRSPFGIVTMATQQQLEDAIWYVDKQVSRLI